MQLKLTQTNSSLFNIYVYKEDLALNNLQWLICHKTRPIQTKSKGIIAWYKTIRKSKSIPESWWIY